MRLFSSFLLGFALCGQTAHAASVIASTTNLVIGPASFVEADTTGHITAIYGGIAGTCLAGTMNGGTCDSCGDTGSLHACNTSSIYPSLPLTITFQSTTAVTNAVSKIGFFLNGATAESGTGVSAAAQTFAANSTTVAISTTWGALCSAVGFGANCDNNGGGSGTFIGSIGYGIDSDNNGSVDDATEMQKITVKIQYIAPGDTTTYPNANTYCATGATTPGYCRLGFEPGDSKAYIKETGPAPLTGGADASGIEFDAIAVFPVKIASMNSADMTAAITNFTTGQAEPPRILPIDTTDNTNIQEESLDGLENYAPYCLIYGNRNKAQNIYRIVAGSAASADASGIAADVCMSPSEVVGLLSDKHCFISTAAFGSDMAKEVKTFRQFRNEFLLSNDLGKLFVKTYYAISPPIAGVIAQNEVLRTMTRGALYPFLAFSYIALHYGIWAALLALTVLLILIFKIKSVVKQKRLLLFLFILMLTPMLKAQIVPETKTVQHPDAADGLVRITQDGTYIYDTKREMKDQSGRITIGHALQPEVSIDIEQRDANGNGTGHFQTFNFGDLYEETSSVIIGYQYERFPWMGKKGKLGYQLGGDLMFAQGHGILVSELTPSREKYTFVTLPFTAGVVYRFEFKDKQLFAPYIAGGGTYTALIEKREDKSSPEFTGAPGFYGVGGLLINISQLDEESGYALESEYGITNLWASLEYKAIEVDSDAFKFSNRYVNLGISFDF